MSLNDSKSITVLFLHKYADLAAAYRYRFAQYYPYFKNHNINIIEQQLFTNSYLKDLFGGKKRSLAQIAKAYCKRIFFLLNQPKCDLICLYMEAFPYLPYFIEKQFLKSKYILDLDDAIYLKYTKSTNPIVKILFANKYAQLFKNAEAVMAGSDELYQYAKKFNPRTFFIPTVVDTNRYTYNPPDEEELPLIIGWIGSPSTYTEVQKRQKIFDRLSKKHDIQLHIIGAQSTEEKQGIYHFFPWSEDKEMEMIHKFDIGIMPITDNDWNRGKCGFKLIQYMAAGIPAVGSAVGANKAILQENKFGLSVTQEAEWESHLSELIVDHQKRKVLSIQARQHIENEYSLKTMAPKYLQAIKESVA